MATCKDCLYVEVCPFKRYRVEKDRMEKRCSFFKDRTRFVELLCKPGDIVYHYCEELHEILDYTVYCINIFRENSITYQADSYDEENDEALSEIGFEPEDIGRDVFLTRDEAEQALKERVCSFEAYPM